MPVKYVWHMQYLLFLMLSQPQVVFKTHIYLDGLSDFLVREINRTPFSLMMKELQVWVRINIHFFSFI